MILAPSTQRFMGLGTSGEAAMEVRVYEVLMAAEKGPH
jgi:hypothetical protein